MLFRLGSYVFKMNFLAVIPLKNFCAGFSVFFGRDLFLRLEDQIPNGPPFDHVKDPISEIMRLAALFLGIGWIILGMEEKITEVIQVGVSFHNLWRGHQG